MGTTCPPPAFSFCTGPARQRGTRIGMGLMAGRDVSQSVLLKSNAKFCEHMQFSEEKVSGFHEILKGTSGPKVIKDPCFGISI